MRRTTVNETHDRASLRDFVHPNQTPTRAEHPHMKGRRPFIACDGSRFHNDFGRQTEIIMVSV